MATTDERELATRLKAQLMDSAGWETDNVAADRKKALDYYFQRPRGDEVKGRSNVVSGDVSAMVEANLSQMLDAFSSDDIVEFEANGPEDDDQAQLESTTVTQFVMRDNNGYHEIGTSVKDALLQRNGFIKAWVETGRRSEIVNLKNATVEAIAALSAKPAVEVEVLQFDGEANTARVRTTATFRKFRCESLAPENFFYLRSWHKIDLQEIPFCAERHIEPRSELMRRGFSKKKVQALKPWAADLKLDSLARDLRQISEHRTPMDKSQDLIEWYECYVLMERGSSGVSERHRIALAGNTLTSILENETLSLVPYASGSAFINPHRLTGISIFDKLRQTQDLNTGLERALMDNVNTVIKNRIAYLDGKVNTDDLSDGRPNGQIRVRSSVGDVRSAVMPFNQTDLSGGILQNLQYQRQVRTELGGASLELASGQMQMAGGRIGSEGVDRAFSVMEQLASHMTKNMATSLIRNTFLLAHATIRAHYDTPVNVKRNGRWQSPVPNEWTERTRVTVKPGMSPGERARRVSVLGQIVQAQLQLAERDMDDVLVNIEGFYKALTDWARAADMPNPEQYWIDPSTPASQQALKTKEANQKQSADQQQALMGQAVGLEQLRTAFNKYKQDTDLQFNYWKEVLGAEVEEAKIVGKATTDLIAQTKFGGKDANGTGDPEPDSVRESGTDVGAGV